MDYAKMATKTGYELSSNTLTCDQLREIIEKAGDVVVSTKINRFSCSIARAKVAKKA